MPTELSMEDISKLFTPQSLLEYRYFFPFAGAFVKLTMQCFHVVMKSDEKLRLK